MTYTQLMQRHLNTRELVMPLVGLTPLQLRAMAYRPGPVFSRVTGERVS